MTTLTFCSSMAQRLESFVSLRRLSGTDYQSQSRLLVYFDNFLAKEHFDEPCLNREIVQCYLSTLSHLYLFQHAQHLKTTSISVKISCLWQTMPRCLSA